MVLDDEEEFMFRPYMVAFAGISRVASYPGEDMFVDLDDKEFVLAAVWALPKVLLRYGFMWGIIPREWRGNWAMIRDSLA